MIHALGFARHTATVMVDPGLIIGFVPLDQTKSELSDGFGKKLDNNAQIWTLGQQLAGGLEKQFARLIGSSEFLQINFLYIFFAFLL